MSFASFAKEVILCPWPPTSVAFRWKSQIDQVYTGYRHICRWIMHVVVFFIATMVVRVYTRPIIKGAYTWSVSR